MLRFQVQVPTASGTVYTPQFAAGERLAMQFNVQETAGNSGTLSVTLQSSADGGANWVDGTALVWFPSASYSASSVTAIWGRDDGTVHHALVRLKVSTSTAVTSVTAYVHLRGRTKAVPRLLYQGVVPSSNAVYSPPFPIYPAAQKAAVQALATVIGASTTPAITVQLQTTHECNNFQNQAATAEINASSTTAHAETSVSGTFDYTASLGPTGRLYLITGGGSGDNTHFVRVYTTEWHRDHEAPEEHLALSESWADAAPMGAPQHHVAGIPTPQHYQVAGLRMPQHRVAGVRMPQQARAVHRGVMPRSANQIHPSISSHLTQTTHVVAYDPVTGATRGRFRG